MPAQAIPLPDQIATLEREIERLNARWKPYAMTQLPQATSVGNPLAINPSPFITKQEIGIQIDEATVRLNELKAQAARDKLAAMESDPDLAALADDLARFTAAQADAERVLREAQAAAVEAKHRMSLVTERHQNIERQIANAEAQAKKWRTELTRDTEKLDEAIKTRTIIERIRVQRAQEAA
jgi:hypothetical protein